METDKSQRTRRVYINETSERLQLCRYICSPVCADTAEVIERDAKPSLVVVHALRQTDITACLPDSD